MEPRSNQGFYWIFLGFPVLHWVLWSFTGFYWVLLGFTDFHWVLWGFTGFHLVLPSVTGFYWVLLGKPGFYWVLLGKPGFYWIFIVFCCALLYFTGFYHVLLGFTRFHWALQGFTVFYCVLLGFAGFLLGSTVFYCVLLGFPGLPWAWSIRNGKAMRNQLIISPRTIRFQSRDPIFQFQTIFQTQDATVFRCPSFLISSDCHLKKKMFRWPSRFALWSPPPKKKRTSHLFEFVGKQPVYGKPSHGGNKNRSSHFHCRRNLRRP